LGKFLDTEQWDHRRRYVIRREKGKEDISDYHMKIMSYNIKSLRGREKRKGGKACR